jgi:hypothetical protein
MTAWVVVGDLGERISEYGTYDVLIPTHGSTSHTAVLS